MDASASESGSGSAAPLLRYFCSQVHCEEGKEDHEVTMKEYNCELARKEKELECKQEELNADMIHLEKISDERTQRRAKFNDALKRERENYELKLNELKTDVYKSKRSLKEIGEVMKRETANLQRIFRKKELEHRQEWTTIEMLRSRGFESLSAQRIGFDEEREVFYREKYAGDERALQEQLLRLQEDKKQIKIILLQAREQIRIDKERQLLTSKELDAINAELGSHDKDTATAKPSAADPGPVKTPTKQPGEQPERLKTTTTRGEGVKEEGLGFDSDIDPATARATAGGGSGGGDASGDAVKQGGMSLDPTHSHSNGATAVSCCSHPHCSQPGTKSCGLCKATAYCSAGCQTADWSRHKESCEGRLHKLGRDYLVKAIGFCEDHDWAKAIKHCDLALTKLNSMVEKRLLDLSVALGYKGQALRALGLHAEALEWEKDMCQDVAGWPLFIAAEKGCIGMIEAAKKGHLEMVQYLVELGVDKDKAGNDGWTALLVAAGNGHLVVVQYLLQQGADKEKANNDCASPFYIAAANGHLGVVRYLVEMGADKEKAADDGWTPLLAAAQKGHLTVVQYLVEQGADKDKANNDGASSLYIAAANGHLGIVQYLIEIGANKDKATNNGWTTPLLAAAMNGHLGVVQYLVELGADKEKAENEGWTALIVAAHEGRLAVVQYLVEMGADKDKAENNGWSPLYIAAQNGHLAVVKYLVEHGADKEKAINKGWTALHVAALNGHLAVVQYLIEIGADKDKANNGGTSPLFVAAQNGHLTVVQFLLQQGADINKATNDRRRPIDVAANEEIKKLIRDEMKRRKKRKPK